MELLEKAYRDFAQTAIKQGITPDACMQYMYGINPSFKNDRIFKDIFPVVFSIEYCTHMLSKSSSKVQ